MPLLTLTQITSSASRAVVNRRAIERRTVARFALGAVPAAVAGSLLFASAPLAHLQRLLGLFLLLVLIHRRVARRPHGLTERAFVGVGAASGLGSALLGSVGPFTAPFFPARGRTRAAYVGTEAACALVMHLTKTAAYGAADLLVGRIALLALTMTAATLAGAWVGKQMVERMTDRLFVLLVEAGLGIAAVTLLVGW